MIVGNTRAVLDAHGAVAEVAEVELSVSRVLTLPARLGGGFLFLGHGGAWVAPRFVAEPRPIAARDIAQAAVGPDFVLLMDFDGLVTLVDPKTGASKTAPVPALVDVATSEDGTTAAASTLHGRAFVTRDGGARWEDVTLSLQGAVLELSLREGRPTFETDRQVWQSVTPEGLETRAALSRPAPISRFGPRWSNSLSPLAVAARSGAPLDDDHALILERSDAMVVRLSDGTIVAHEAGAVPSGHACELTALPSEVLFLCRGSGKMVVLRRPRSGGSTVVERRFDRSGGFVRGGDDALLFDGPCDDPSDLPGVACLRGEDGAWRELDQRGAVSDRAPDDRADVVRWLPKKGGALLFVLGPKSGVVVDGATGKSRPVDARVLGELRGVVQPRGATLEWRLHVDAEGGISGWDPSNRNVRVSADLSTIERSSFELQGVVRGPVGIGRGSSAALFQSKDWGRTFQEIARAPFAMSAYDSVGACSEVGCLAGTWVRVGFPEDPPTPKAVAPRSVLRPSDVKAPRPRLVCAASGAMTRKARPIASGERAGFGAEAAADDGVNFHGLYHAAAPGLEGATMGAGLFAAVTGPMVLDPTLGPTGREPRRVRFVEPFDPEAVVRSNTTRLGAWLDATRSTGGGTLDLEGSEDGGQALPVSGDGLLLWGARGGSTVTWLRNGKTTVLSLGADADPSALVSAAQTGPDELVVRITDDEGVARLRRLAPGLASDERELPRVPVVASATHGDAVARLPDGALAVIRASRVNPPTREHPAWLLRPDAQPEALAPWSTLTLDGSPGCDGTTGAAAVITARRSWLETGPLSVDEELPFVARVRWSPERVCLEAVIAPFARHELAFGSFDSALVARFGKDAKAGHVLLGAGVELREPRTCVLEPPAKGR